MQFFTAPVSNHGGEPNIHEMFSQIYHRKLLSSYKQDEFQQGISAGVGEIFAVGRAEWLCPQREARP